MDHTCRKLDKPIFSFSNARLRGFLGSTGSESLEAGRIESEAGNRA